MAGPFAQFNFKDIINWKNTNHTLGFLVLMNVAYLVFHCMNLRLISFASHKLIVYSLVLMFKLHVLKKSSTWFTRESIEKCYVQTYDAVNKALDRLRRMTMLQDVSGLTKLFSVIQYNIAFDVFVLYNGLKQNEKYHKIKQIATDISSRLLDQNIPKYKGE